MIRKIALAGLLALVFTIPWENAITVSTLGTLSRVIGLGAAGVWMVSVVVEGRLRKLQLFHIWAFLFAAINVASIFWTIDYDLTYYRVKTFSQLAILTWMLWDLVDTPGGFRALLQAFILGGYLAVGSSINNYVTGQIISEYEFGRYSGANQNAVEFAIILSVCFPTAWYLATSGKSGRFTRFWQAVNFAFIPAALFAIILTASRTALVTVVPGALYIMATLGRIRVGWRILIFIVFIAGIFLAKSFIPVATIERLGTFSSSVAGADLGGRVGLWGGAIQIFLKHPILGIGSYSLESPNQLGGFAHNTFLSIMAELGIIGFLIFVGWLSSVVLAMINQTRSMAILSATIFIVWLFSVQSVTWEYSKPTWFFLNIIVISAAIYPRKKEQPEGGSVSVSQPASPDTLLGGMNS